MLVTFSCPAYANITMSGDVAVSLLKLMGHSGTVPGAFRAEDVEAALVRLQAAIDADQRSPEPEESGHEEDDQPPISLSLRALPLVELLGAAVEAKSDVMWKSG